MNSSKIFLPESKSFEELMLGKKRYKVPTFQRNYRWKEQHWNDLWEDILAIENANDPHYMGSVILKKSSDNEYEIIDGQQRFTTITLLILAIYSKLQELQDKHIEEEKNKQRINDILLPQYIGKKTCDDLTPERKLYLNKDDEEFFSLYLINLEYMNIKGKLPLSQDLLYKAFLFFKDKIDEKFNDSSGKEIIEFLVNVIASKLLFISIEVTDTANAYLLFETLNARGLELSVTDLLKNYIFSLAKNENDQKLLENRWMEISKFINLEEFPTFIRYYLNSRIAYTTEKNMYNILKDKIKTKQDAEKLLTELKNIAMLYVALKDPENDYWDECKQNTKIRELLREITLFDNKTFKILAISAYLKLNENNFIKVLEYCKNIIFRYTIISKRNPKNMETTFSQTAIKISKNEIKTLNDILENLKSIYINDKDFISNFNSATIKSNNSKNKNTAKYILAQIEKSNKNIINYKDSEISLEHILPKSPSEDWIKIFGKDYNDYIYRIANYLLLNKNINKKVENGSFKDKKLGYLSNENIQFSEKDYFESIDSWTPKEFNKRSNNMAQKAKNIWKISEYKS